MNRTDLQRLAEIRIQEAKLLLDHGFQKGAYYLAGYAVECALKACIAKKIQEHDFPDLKLARDSHNHDLESLLRTAGLQAELQAEGQSNEEIAKNWRTVASWTVEARYETADQFHFADDLISAIMNPENGVFLWQKKRW